jgi:hypothetical protein
MPLQKGWRPLERSTVGSAPNRYGVVEFGTDGEPTAIEVGVVRDVLKEALAYADHEQARWEATQGRDHAERLAREHRDRL